MLPAFIFLRVHEKVLLQSSGVQKELNQAQKTRETFGKKQEYSSHGYGRQECEISTGKFKTREHLTQKVLKNFPAIEMTQKMIGRESKMEGCGEARAITLFSHFCKPVSCKATVSALLHLSC